MPGKAKSNAQKTTTRTFNMRTSRTDGWTKQQSSYNKEQVKLPGEKKKVRAVCYIINGGRVLEGGFGRGNTSDVVSLGSFCTDKQIFN